MAKGNKEWEDSPMPFDVNMMAYGGFCAMVSR